MPASMPPRSAPVLAAVLLALSIPLSAGQATLRDCQRWKDRIDHLTDQRRAGGSARQMERWKRRRQVYRERFIEGACRRYGR
jgi:hypothetical protein